MNHRSISLHRVRVSRLFALIACATLLCAQAGPTFPDPGKTSMSRNDQVSLGMQASNEVFKQMPVLPDTSPETQYVRQLGQKLVATIPSQYSWPFEFHVVPQKEINAFALPGGQMFVNVGTITSAGSEAQLAGVIAHEMAHVYMQHSAKQAGKAQTTGLVAQLAAMALGATVGDKAGGLVGQLGTMGIQLGAQGLMMKYSRSDESQADAVGAVILYKAGYNPQAMADFFKTLEAQGGAAPPAFFSDHPNPGNRQQAIQTEIANWPRKSFTTSSNAFAQTHQHALGVKAYTAAEIEQGAKSGQWAASNKRSGAVPGQQGGSVFPTAAEAAGPAKTSTVSLQSVAPSQHTVVADVGPMKMQRPQNWSVAFPQQQGQFVTIAPKAGVTDDGIGYGVLLNGVTAQQIQGMKIDDVTARLVQMMEKNNGAKPLGEAQRVTVAGLDGRYVMMQSTSPFAGQDGQPQPERDWLVTVRQRDGAVVFMIFVAPENHFVHFKPAFDSMLKSIQFK